MAYDPETAFTDEMVESLQDINQFLVLAITKDEPPIVQLKDKIDATLTTINNTHSSFFAVLDAADEALRNDKLFPEDVDNIIEDLMDDLHQADPLYRVFHSPSDGWSAIQKLTGDGFLEPIAYFSSPNLAEESIEFIESRDR